MFQRISVAITKRANRKSLIITAIFFLLMQYLMSISPFGVQAVKTVAPGVTILDMQLNYSPADAHRTLIDLQPAGRAVYLRTLLIDFVFIVSYIIFLMISLTLLSRFLLPKSQLYRFVWIVPLAGGKFDALENCCFLLQLHAIPGALPGVAVFSNVFTLAKFGLVGTAELAFMVGGIVWLLIILIRSMKKDWQNTVTK